MGTKEQAQGVVEAVRGFVKRSLDPVREHLRGLAERADKQYQKIEALEARVAALERKQGQKSGAVYITKVSR